MNRNMKSNFILTFPGASLVQAVLGINFALWLATSAAQAESLPNMQTAAASQAKFLTHVAQDSTMRQIQKLLPSKTTFSAPVWRDKILGDIGNEITFRGSLDGSVLFLKKPADGEEGYPEKAPYSQDDPVNFLFVVASVPASWHDKGALYIRALSHTLGKPTTAVWDKKQLYWEVIWILPNQREIRYGVDGYSTRLTLWFRHHSQSGDT